MRAYTLSAALLGCTFCAHSVSASPLGTRDNYNVSLEHPELFTLHRNMLLQNSTSGFETPMSDFLSDYLRNKGLTVELARVENPVLE